jgi:hypothetical protein
VFAEYARIEARQCSLLCARSGVRAPGKRRYFREKSPLSRREIVVFLLARSW